MRGAFFLVPRLLLSQLISNYCPRARSLPPAVIEIEIRDKKHRLGLQLERKYAVGKPKPRSGSEPDVVLIYSVRLCIFQEI